MREQKEHSREQEAVDTPLVGFAHIIGLVTFLLIICLMAGS